MTGVDETTPFVVNIGNGRINNTSKDDKNRSSARSTSFRKKFSVEGLRESAGSISKSFSEDLSRIGFLGSTAIGVNSLIGPAMLYLPDTYQRSGLIPTTGTYTCHNYCFISIGVPCRFHRHRRSSIVVIAILINVSISNSNTYRFAAVIIFVCILSALCCLHMSNTISKVHNNKHFSLDVSQHGKCVSKLNIII